MPTLTNFFTDYTTYCDKYRGYEEFDPDELFRLLIGECTYCTPAEKSLIKQSYELAKRGHAGQLRKSGKPYITHPLTVAHMMLEHRPSAILLSATLLHDTLEDTTVSKNDIESIHPDIARIVEAATKIRKDTNTSILRLSSDESKFETMRKILVASQKDISALYLKLFDRLHNMITISSMKPSDIKRIAKETNQIYVPLAKRSGLRHIYHLLRGLTTEILEPARWNTLWSYAMNSRHEIEDDSQELVEYLSAQNWSKRVYSIKSVSVSPFSIDPGKESLSDSWYAISMTVQKGSDCYAILHDIALRQDENCIQVGKLQDFMNNPRLSGYIGLHFDIIFAGMHRIELRIVDKKTEELVTKFDSFEALGKKYSSALFRDFDLINEATKSNSSEFMSHVTEHILARKIPLHSKTRPLFYMPVGSTVLDAIIYLEPQKYRHVEKIYQNGGEVPFSTQLENHDIVLYSLSKSSQLSKKWLKFVHSSVSEFRIKKHLLRKK